jgi:hypothetical protein
MSGSSASRRHTALAAGVGAGLAGAGYLVHRRTTNGSDAEAALVAACTSSNEVRGRPSS